MASAVDLLFRVIVTLARWLRFLNRSNMWYCLTGFICILVITWVAFGAMITMVLMSILLLGLGILLYYCSRVLQTESRNPPSPPVQLATSALGSILRQHFRSLANFNFAQFALKPPELRETTWEMFAAFPRVVPIQHVTNWYTHQQQQVSTTYIVPAGPCSPLFFVDRAANYVVNRRHTKLTPREPGSPFARFNPNSDCLWVLGSFIRYYEILNRAAHSIRYLALNITAWQNIMYNPYYFAEYLDNICTRGIRRVYIIVGGEKFVSHPELTFVYPPWRRPTVYYNALQHGLEHVRRIVNPAPPGGDWLMDQFVSPRKEHIGWPRACEKVQQSVAHFHHNILEERRLWIADGNVANPVDAEMLCQTATNCDNWDIPEIVFAEATIPDEIEWMGGLGSERRIHSTDE